MTPKARAWWARNLVAAQAVVSADLDLTRARRIARQHWLALGRGLGARPCSREHDNCVATWSEA